MATGVMARGRRRRHVQVEAVPVLAAFVAGEAAELAGSAWAAATGRTKMAAVTPAAASKVVMRRRRLVVM